MDLLVTALLVFGRLGGLLLVLPGVSARGVPKHVAALGGIALTATLAPVVPLAETPEYLGTLILGMAGELFLGIMMGSAVAVIFGAFGMASELMEQEMGSRIPLGPDPFMFSQQGPLGTLASWLATLSFLLVGLHHDAIQILGDSFHYLPPGGVTSLSGGGVVLMEAVSWALFLGVRLAAPVLALVWMVNVFVAILVKLAPNMNVFFSIGMVMTNMSGLVLFGLGLPYLLLAHTTAIHEGLDAMTRLVLSAGR